MPINQADKSKVQNNEQNDQAKKPAVANDPHNPNDPDYQKSQPYSGAKK